LKFTFRLIFLSGAVLMVGCQALTSTVEAPTGTARELATTPAKQVYSGTIPIRQARQLEGKTVRVSGTVTVPSGAFASSISSGFAIQDGTAGIYVIDNAHAYQLGQKVMVAGTVGAENRQRNIKLQKSTLLGESITITPRPVRTGGLGEAEGGYLVVAEGLITSTMDDGAYGYKLFVDDGSGPCQVFINASTDLMKNAASWEAGDVIRVVGFVGRYNEVYEIMPRILSDIQKN
jgi:hypothetical protein